MCDCAVLTLAKHGLKKSLRSKQLWSRDAFNLCRVEVHLDSTEIIPIEPTPYVSNDRVLSPEPVNEISPVRTQSTSRVQKSLTPQPSIHDEEIEQAKEADKTTPTVSKSITKSVRSLAKSAQKSVRSGAKKVSSVARSLTKSGLQGLLLIHILLFKCHFFMQNSSFVGNWQPHSVSLHTLHLFFTCSSSHSILILPTQESMSVALTMKCMNAPIMPALLQLA